jgi:hypothetical protein
VLAPASANGTGIALDPSRIAGCEYQTSGGAAGEILCAQTASDGTIENGYEFKWGGIDETFEGVWIAPITFDTYAMKGFRVVSPKGYSKAARRLPDAKAGLVTNDPAATLKASQVIAGASLGKASPELIARLKAIATDLRR